MNDSHRATLRTHGTMVGRMLMGLIFVYTGVGIIIGGVGNTATFMENLGVPLAGVLVYLVLLIKLGAGGSLMLGYRTGLSAALLILFLMGTITLAHLDVNDINLWKELSMIGGLLYVMAYGPGDGWSLDKRNSASMSSGMPSMSPMN